MPPVAGSYQRVSVKPFLRRVGAGCWRGLMIFEIVSGVFVVSWYHDSSAHEIPDQQISRLSRNSRESRRAVPVVGFRMAPLPQISIESGLRQGHFSKSNPNSYLNTHTMKSPLLRLTLACLFCWATLIPLRVQAIPLWVFAGGGTSSPAPTYLVNQNFEGTGYDNGESWAETGTPDEDHTGTVLVGSQSCLVEANEVTYTTYAGQTTVYAYCRLKRNAQSSSANTTIFAIRNSSNTTIAALRFNYSNPNTEFKLYANGGDSTASSTTQGGDNSTVWHVWLTYVSGGTCELAMSTTGTKPSVDGSGAVFLTRTGSSDTAERISLLNGSSGSVIYDKVLVSASPIGNNP